MPLPKFDLLGELYSILGKTPPAAPAKVAKPAAAPKVAPPSIANPIEQLLASQPKPAGGPAAVAPTSIMAQPAGQKAVQQLKTQTQAKGATNPLDPYQGKTPVAVPYDAWSQATPEQQAAFLAPFPKGINTPKPPVPFAPPPISAGPPPSIYQTGMSFDDYITAKGLDPNTIKPAQANDLLFEYHAVAAAKAKATFPKITDQAAKVPTAPPAQKLRPLSAESEQFRKQFNIDAYHGTDAATPFDEFRLPPDELGVHIGTVKAAHDIKSIGSAELYSASNERIYPLKARIQNPLELEDKVTWYPDNIANQLREKGFPADEVNFAEKMGAPGLRTYLQHKGYDGIKYVNKGEDPGSVSYVVWDPAQLRTPHAAFDPQKSQSRNLMAGVAGATAVAGALATDDQAEAAGFPKILPAEGHAGLVGQTVGKALYKPGMTFQDYAATKGIKNPLHLPAEQKTPLVDEYMNARSSYYKGEAAAPVAANQNQPFQPGPGRAANSAAAAVAAGVLGTSTPASGNPVDDLLASSRPSSASSANPIDELLSSGQPIENAGYAGYAGDVAHEFQSGLQSVRGAHDQETQRRLGILPSHGAAADFASEFLQIAGGLFGMAASPITGAVRQYGARPLAGTLPAQPEPERPGLFQPFKNLVSGASERARQSAARPFGKQGTEEEQLERATNVLALGVPGIGVTKLPKVGASVSAIRQSPAFKTIEKIFSPTTIDQDAKDAEALLRTTTGIAARDTESTRAAMEPFHRAINKLPEADRLNFIDHIEGGQGGIANLSPTLRALGGEMRDAFELRAAKLTALPSMATTHFLDDYFPHFWQDPHAAAAFAKNFAGHGAGAPKGGGGSKQGSGASLKKREIPTIADGIKAGLKPLTTDPIEATMRYVGSMDRFIASTSVLDFSKQAGYVKYIRPKVYGASGHPESFKPPAGWVPLKGRGARNFSGAQAYAPEGFARVYNNFIDRGIHEWGPTSGSVYDAVQKASNNITALELGLSGYHVVTMANEAAISRMARGISDVVGGAGQRDAMRMLRGAGAVASAPLAPLTSVVRGAQLERVYLGRNPGSPDMNRIVDLLEKAGGRAVGSSHASDYQYSAAGSYVKAFKQGALKMQMQTAAADIAAHPIVGTARQAVTQLGRIMSTVSAPIFEQYIPRLKNGAFYDTMNAWLRANPAATRDVQVKMARDVWDSIDNRFGELVDDNIFWNKTLKQAAKLGMRSYSWNLGTAREIGGGAIDLASGKWSPRAAYLIALPIQVGTMNAVYQKLATGKDPESVQDLLGGQTGGEQSLSIPSTQPYARSAKSTVPERVSIPGYQKDVLGWYENWEQEMLNKRSKLVTMVGELASNTDWRGDPIINPEDSAPEWMKQYFDYALKSLTPISMQSSQKGIKEGSKIGRGQQMMGLKQAPPYVADPEGYARQQKNVHVLRAKKKERYDKKQERVYGGTE
jgi:hypothetical protein